MQSYVVVGTDVFSYLWQGRNQSDRYEAALKNTIPVLSFTSIAQIYFGAYSANWGGPRLRQLEAAVRPYLVVLWDSEIAKLWGSSKLKHVVKGTRSVRTNMQMTCGFAQLQSATTRSCLRITSGTSRRYPA
jgi:predicted nucleic acid-binding protein